MEISASQILGLIKDKLSIEIEVDNEPAVGSDRDITARLYLDGELISESSDTIDMDEFIEENEWQIKRNILL